MDKIIKLQPVPNTAPPPRMVSENDGSPTAPNKSTVRPTDHYQMGGHKLHWHPERVAAWMRGERIAPLHIDVGLSKGCNIACTYCYGVTQGNFYIKGARDYFPREPLLQYMKDAGEIGVRSMALIGEAEPTLNPHLYEAIVTGKKAGVDISIGTNGVLFDDGKDGHEALEHLSWIRFNISAGTNEGYEKVHQSKNFNQVVRKIKFCVETKKKYNLDVTVGLQMVLTPDNVDQCIPLAVLGRELEVDYCVIKQCSDTVHNDLGIFDRLHEYSNFTDVLKRAEEETTKDYTVIVKWKKIANQGKRGYDRCFGVPFLLYSSGDGRLYPCGMFFDDREEEMRMGDMNEMTFKQIWESDRYWEIAAHVAKVMDCHTECYVNCRTHEINEYVWQLKHPPQHLNFV